MDIFSTRLVGTVYSDPQYRTRREFISSSTIIRSDIGSAQDQIPPSKDRPSQSISGSFRNFGRVMRTEYTIRIRRTAEALVKTAATVITVGRVKVDIKN